MSLKVTTIIKSINRQNPIKFTTFAILGFILEPFIFSIIKNNNLPRGVRKVETELAPGDFENLLSTLSQYDKGSLLVALENAVNLYIELRIQLFSKKVNLHFETQKRVLDYWSEIKKN